MARKKPGLLSFTSLLSAFFTIVCLGLLVSSVGIFLVVLHYSQDLPDYSQLSEYNPPTVTRLYAADGQMLAEYALEKRLYVPITGIPKRLVNAFVAAEDKNFYQHPGIDFAGIFRAAVHNIINYGKNKTLAGGSTITQQVVKNFLLSNEKSVSRKIKEAILSFRITQAYSKDRIMELYLNQIYLGNRSFGVAAAALNYFNKSISELTVEEAALLASMPKAPSSLDPHHFPDRAKERRDWVIERMEEEGYITDVEAMLAIAAPIKLAERDSIELVNAGFFSDVVKQQLDDLYGNDKVMKGGLVVRTTLDPTLQQYAEKALMEGLVAYDHRHGWRGPLAKTPASSNVADTLKTLPQPPIVDPWRVAGVTAVSDASASIYFKDGSHGTVALADMSWARKFVNRDSLGSQVTKVSQVLQVGDIIAVSPRPDKGNTAYGLEQIPEVNGAIAVMDPHTGRVLAMVGGYYYGGSQFNRAFQAKRQPGSAFKPFVYLAALENGFEPNSIIVDEEVQLDQGGNNPVWKPQNHTGEYYGPTTLRVGVEKSRNAMTVRLTQQLGISKVVEIAKRLGITPNPERNFSLALGTAETTVLDLTNAYAMLANGGKKVIPSLIERIQDNTGKTLYYRDHRECVGCSVTGDIIADGPDNTPPSLTETREQLIDPIATYQMVSILEGVIQRGTGRAARDLNRTIAGKTGTTNDSFDAWFMGFSPDLVAGVYVGFDSPQSLGKHEYGAGVALPVWHSFMQQALANKPDIPFRRPAGVKLVKIDVKSGLLPSADTPAGNIIFEAFKAGTEPTSSTPDILPSDGNGGTAPLEDLGTGGVY